MKNLKQLKELYLRGTAVTDFTALNDLKAQLNFLFLPSTVSTATRLSFLSDTVYLKEGQELSIKEFTKGVFVNDTALRHLLSLHLIRQQYPLQEIRLKSEQKVRWEDRHKKLEQQQKRSKFTQQTKQVRFLHRRLY